MRTFLSFNNSGKRLLTITFGIPKQFYEALAKEMGTITPGILAEDSEVEEYLRDVVQQNLDYIIETHRPKPPRLRARRRRRASTA